MKTLELHESIKNSVINYLRDVDLIKVVISKSYKRKKEIIGIPIGTNYSDYTFKILCKEPKEVAIDNPNYISALDLLSKLRLASNDKGRDNKLIQVILNHKVFDVVSVYYMRYPNDKHILFLNVL